MHAYDTHLRQIPEAGINTFWRFGSLCALKAIQINIYHLAVSHFPELKTPINSILHPAFKIFFIPDRIFKKTVVDFTSLYLPNVSLGSQINILAVAASAYTEEIGMKCVKDAALPFFAKKLPNSVGDILNYRWTRITLTATWFSLSHVANWGHEGSFFSRFLGGMLSGWIMDQYGLRWSGLIHMTSNLYFLHRAAISR